MASIERTVNIGVNEVISDKEQWFIKLLRQGIGEAIAEVEPGGVAAATPKALVRLSRNTYLGKRYGLNRQGQSSDELVKCNSGAGAIESVHHNCGFEEAGR
jgi:hypothetical protein